MELKDRLQGDVADAMRAGETQKRDTLRLLLAAIKQAEVDQRRELDGAGILGILTKQAKQRRESISDAKRAGRDDLVEQELAELAIIEPYLPQMMSEEEIRELTAAVITSTGANSISDLGLVMGKTMPEIKGNADGREVNKIVRDLLRSKATSVSQ